MEYRERYIAAQRAFRAYSDACERNVGYKYWSGIAEAADSGSAVCVALMDLREALTDVDDGNVAAMLDAGLGDGGAGGASSHE